MSTSAATLKPEDVTSHISGSPPNISSVEAYPDGVDIEKQRLAEEDMSVRNIDYDHDKEYEMQQKFLLFFIVIAFLFFLLTCSVIVVVVIVAMLEDIEDEKQREAGVVIIWLGCNDEYTNARKANFGRYEYRTNYLKEVYQRMADDKSTTVYELFQMGPERRGQIKPYCEQVTMEAQEKQVKDITKRMSVEYQEGYL